jgi:hypothetical protein
MPEMRLGYPEAGNGKTAYYEMLPLVMTTFMLPRFETRGNAITVNTEELLAKMPYSAFAVREPFTGFYEDGTQVTGFETALLVYDSETSSVRITSKIEYDDRGNGRRTVYPADVSDQGVSRDNRYAEAASIILRLYQALYGRKHRFIDKSVSRQVRRSEARPSGYREYIVIGEDSREYAKASRPSEIVRRLRRFHFVRQHPRTYKKTGKTVWVKSHSRGSIGNAAQVKDYRIGEPSNG